MQALVAGYGLTEAARWYREYGLLFSDMTRGGVYRLDAAGVATVVAHRKAIGGLVAHASGGLVVTGRNVTHKISPAHGDEQVVLLAPEPDELFFNDIGADARGRLFVGSMPGAGHDAGRFYLIELDGAVHVLTEELQIANGIVADPSDTRLYSVDSGPQVVWRFDLADRAADIAASRQVFVDTSEYEGVPDGAAMAADGSLWVAMAGGGLIVGWDERGERVGEIAVPHALATAVAFGGPERDVLYILTGDNADYPNAEGGTVFRTVAPTRGLPAPYAGVRRVSR